MEAKKKAAETANIIIEQTECKDSAISLKNKVLSALKNERLTAIMLNRRFGFNDSRKVISVLRREGHPIIDCLLNDRRKVYFCEKSAQMELFQEKGGDYELC